jgi:hypothetical protein
MIELSLGRHRRGRVPHFRTREPFVGDEPGQRRPDPPRPAAQAETRARGWPPSRCRTRADGRGSAAEHFLHDTLPLDELSGTTQTPQDYVEQVSATTGMPWANVRRNMAKVHGVLSKVEEVLAGSRAGSTCRCSTPASAGRRPHAELLPRADALGVVLPSNSPGVHSLWAPATVLKMPLVLKPGSAEPWTPYRIIQAWIKAGLPPRSSLLPGRPRRRQRDPAQCGRGMVFGDVASTKRWKAIRASRCTGPATARSSSAPTRPTTGNATST